MILGSREELQGILRKHGWQPGAGSGWDTAKTVKELRFFHDMGFDALEITAELISQTGAFFKFTPEEWRQTRTVVEEAGMRCHSVLAWRRMICRQPWAEEKWQDLLHIAKVSEVLGVKIVSLFIAPPKWPTGGGPGGSRPMLRSLWDATDRDFEVSAQKLKTYAKQLADFGAAITLEIHDDSINDCAPSTLRLLKMIDEPNVGVNPDTLDNAWLYPGEDVPDAVEQAKMVAPYVNHWHIKQYVRTQGPDGEWQQSGAYADEGTQPIGTYALHFLNAGFNGAVVPECGRGADAAYNLRRFCDYMVWLRDEYVPNMPPP